jgi:dihydropteroate synthase
LLTLPEISALFDRYAADFDLPIAKFDIGGRAFDFDAEPALMGVVNLSADSWYRESIATTPESAISLGRAIASEGAHLIDVGAEATMAETATVNAKRQIEVLVPVINGLRAENLLVSVETYQPSVVEACLAAGANLLNLTGQAQEEAIFEMAGETGAAVVICYVQGDTIREVRDFADGVDFTDAMIAHFESRIKRAQELGVSRIFIDPVVSSPRGGIDRMRHQALTLITTFRLRVLGWPICNALLAGADFFPHNYREVESFFAVFGALGRTNMYRTHEVTKVRAVLGAMRALS